MERLLEAYAAGKKGIRGRLADFKKLGNASGKDLFYELCFCVMTANGSAKAGMRAQECLERNGFWETGKTGGCLDEVRFGSAKAGYLMQNRRNLVRDSLSLGEFLEGDPFEVRERIVRDKKHFKGLGYKEASHFLRNVGRGGNLAILDRHILSELCGHNVICSVPDHLSRKKYLEIERKMQGFSERVGIPMGELDLLFWSMRTGFVLK